MATKLFIFDLGKVLIDFDFAVAIKRLQGLCLINHLKLFALFRNSDLAREWDCGRLPPDQFYQRIQQEMNFPMSMEEFIPIWNEIFTPKREMITLARSLKAHYKVVILSNTNAWHADYIRRNFPWIAEFDHFIASCDVGLLKPDPKIYEIALRRGEAAPSEAVYIDDIAEYVRAARALGIDGLVFKDFPTLRKDLLSKGIPLNGDEPQS